MFWQLDWSKDVGKLFEALSSIQEKESFKSLKNVTRGGNNIMIPGYSTYLYVDDFATRLVLTEVGVLTENITQVWL